MSELTRMAEIGKRALDFRNSKAFKRAEEVYIENKKKERAADKAYPVYKKALDALPMGDEAFLHPDPKVRAEWKRLVNEYSAKGPDVYNDDIVSLGYECIEFFKKIVK